MSVFDSFLGVAPDRNTDVALFADHLKAALSETRATRVVNLSSREGDLWQRLYPSLTAGGKPLSVILTDESPNANAPADFRSQGEKGLSYHPDAIEPAAVPRDLTGFRTLFVGFDSVTPPQLRAILADAVAAGQGIGIFATSAGRAFTSEELWEIIEGVPGEGNYAWEVRRERESDARHGTFIIGYPARP